jgi:rhodanese-related sulfurtransferase
MLSGALAAGLCSVGADVIMLDVVPTPAVAYLVGKYKADAGVMISASHNSAEFNGIKIFSGDGYKLPDDLEERIEAIVLDKVQPEALAAPQDIGKVIHKPSAIKDYVDHVKSSVAFSLDGLNIAVDCANGSASASAARLFCELGANATVLFADPDGLNIKEVVEYYAQHGTTKGFPGSQNIDGTTLLALPVDVLVPAALENQITLANADQIKAKIVAEAANGPTTPEAARILTEKGILQVPDILCNAGGVTVSYFEWVQNLQNYYWTEEEVNDKLEHMMVNAFNAVFKVREQRKVSMRRAAYMVAVKRLADAMTARGWL